MKRIIILILLIGLTAGCSPTRQIANTVQATGQDIATARDHIAAASKMVEDQPAPFAELAAADGALVSAQERLSEVPKLLTGTTDKVSPWLTWLTWGAIAIVAVVVGYLLWRSGVLGLVGAWIAAIHPPAATASAAVLAAKSDNGDPTAGAASVAVLRATNPGFNKAYRRASSSLAPSAAPASSVPTSSA
ncbi:MAG: hypothetical protein V2A79_14945 [Planctomycetota bacterium]